MYKVLLDFKDLKDGNYRYKAGEEYPRQGAKPTQKRIAELLGDKNKMKRPLIVEESVEEETEVEPEKPKKTTKKKAAKKGK